MSVDKNLNIKPIDLKTDTFGVSFNKTNDNFSELVNYLSKLGTQAKTETFIANKGQTNFKLVQGVYIPGTSTVKVVVDGVEQVTRESYKEVSPNEIEFTEPLVAGQVVNITYTTISTITSLFETKERVTLDGGNFQDSVDTDTIIVDGGSFGDTADRVYDGESFTRGAY